MGQQSTEDQGWPKDGCPHSFSSVNINKLTSGQFEDEVWSERRSYFQPKISSTGQPLSLPPKICR